MNKSHSTARTGTRARSSVAAARVRESLLERDEFDDDREGPWISPVLDEDDDWAEAGTEAAHAGSRYREQTDDSLAPEVETEINLLLHGVSYR